ncbi:hypothetical protein ATCC90586_007354 [Pythium insidiosum]|nr:hypothetical protein ATCC90586_007354 [Pythium insidiosum]
MPQREQDTQASVARMRTLTSHLVGGGRAPATVDASAAEAPASAPRSSSPAATRWNGWGYDDTKLFINRDGDVEISGERYADVFHGAKDRTLPQLRPWAERAIALDVKRTSFATNRRPEDLEVAEAPRSADTQAALAAFLDALRQAGVRVSESKADRVRHGHGQTCAEIYRLRHARDAGRVPDVVVWPTSHAQVERIVAEASRRSETLCLVPYGGGTNVSNALQCEPHESRVIVSVDLGDMKRVLHVDKENMVVRAEAGITGLELHERLRLRGLTLGHEPDSWEFSTLGGWVATRASGMKKNAYGNIEDLVVNLRVVTPRGTIARAANAPRVAMGPDVHHAVLGSEGVLGVVTEATLRVRPFPATQVFDSFIFPTFAHGVAALAEITRAGCVPASLRLMDNTQFQLGQALKPRASNRFTSGVLDFAKKAYVTKFRGFDVSSMCAATVVMEGDARDVARQHEQITAIAKRHDGLVGGAENGQRGYFFTYVIAYLRDFAFDYYFLSESFETAVPWANAQQLVHDIKRAIHETAARTATLQTAPLIACRISQVYDAGVCVYVYYGINYFGVDDPLALFHAVEAAAVDAMVANGAALSHHHGIGKHRREWLPAAISAPAVAVLHGIKHALDPDNVLAAGNLLLKSE